MNAVFEYATVLRFDDNSDSYRILDHFDLVMLGSQKFLCSTVRPSKLSSDEIHDLKNISSFVADFFDYLPLENPIQLVRSFLSVESR